MKVYDATIQTEQILFPTYVWFFFSAITGRVILMHFLCRLLNGNMLSGSLPDELGNLPNLNRFQVDENQLSGSLPDSLANMTSVKHLWVDLLAKKLSIQLGGWFLTCNLSFSYCIFSVTWTTTHLVVNFHLHFQSYQIWCICEYWTHLFSYIYSVSNPPLHLGVHLRIDPFYKFVLIIFVEMTL